MSFKVGPFDITDRGRTLVIAEAGVNHNGDVELAKQMVRTAKAAGADCIKFQTFKADQLALHTAPKAPYQLQSANDKQSQLDMLRALELSQADYVQIADLCRSEQLVFLSTPYSCQDVDLLESLGVEAYKIASGQTVEPLFLEYVAAKGMPILMSTGMCTLGEVQRAVKTIRSCDNDQILVLQCTTSYPSVLDDANLLAMVTMRQHLDVLVGYSDHTQTHTAAMAAVALGASVVERHFTLDKTLPGPDQSCSSNKEEFALWVQAIRDTDRALGSPTKKPTRAEQKNMTAVRRGVVAVSHIPAGTKFSMQNLAMKRPASDLTGEDLQDILGRKASQTIEPDTPLTREMIQ